MTEAAYGNPAPLIGKPIDAATHLRQLFESWLARKIGFKL